mgnify:CR=1 FL=1|jgi:hypothetical protein
MSDLRFGRYFILEGKTANLFSWLEHHLELDWSIEAKGICSVTDQLALVAIFSTKEDLCRFESEFLDNQKNNSPIYNNRRDSGFDWPAAQERRGGIDRRQGVSKKDTAELERRFLREEVTELGEKHDENFSESIQLKING